MDLNIESRTWMCTKKDCTTDVSDFIILDGRFDHNHAESEERTQASYVRKRVSPVIKLGNN